MATATRTPFRLGTRGSALALVQAQRVAFRLRKVRPELDVEPIAISTEGDRDKVSPLSVIGGRGVFTSGVQGALAGGTVAAAVHSAKDLPPLEPPGLTVAAFPERED